MEKQITPPEGCFLASPGEFCSFGDLYLETDGDNKWHSLIISTPEQYNPEIHYPRAIKIQRDEAVDELLGAIKGMYRWLTDNKCPNHYKILRSMRIAEKYIPYKER